jgi:hypothetical protein
MERALCVYPVSPFKQLISLHIGSLSLLVGIIHADSSNPKAAKPTRDKGTTSVADGLC